MSSLTVPLERLVEQLPARNEILQHRFQPLRIERTRQPGDPGDGSGIEPGRTIFIGIEQAEVDAIGALVIVIIDVDAGFGILVLLQNALADRLFDRTERCYRGVVSQSLHRTDAVLLENPLHPADGVALAVQQATNALE